MHAIKFPLFVLVFVFFPIVGGAETTQKVINLQPLQKSFKKLVSKQLNKKDCERQVFIKGAKLTINDETLSVKINARITRQYCRRRAKLKVYEKTGEVIYNYRVKIDNNEIILTDESKNNNSKKFEKSLTDVFEQNSKQKIADTLTNILFQEMRGDSAFMQEFKNLNYNKNIKINANSKTITISIEN